ncbi:MAG: translocation/assembly module TamB domain-containing protein, partial [Gammaproteobacteria bacterium]
ASPAVRAEGRFEAERYAAPRPLGPVTNVLLTARWEGRTLTLDALEAQVGKGRLRVTGKWDFGARGNPLTARLEGTELLVVDEQLIRLRVNPELVLTKSEAGWRLEGSVQAPLVLMYAELAAGKLETGPRKVKEVRPPGISLPQAPEGGFLVLPGIPGLDAVKLDVRAATSGECRIENNVVGALVEAEARVRGTLAAPALSGVARTRSGEVKLTTGVFIRIETAEAVLPAEPGRVPRLRFEGRTGYGKGAIRLSVDGPLAGPELRLSSDPPRSQEELLAYLAFGQFPGNVSGTGALGVFALRFYKEQTDARPRAEPRESFFDRLNPEIHSPEEKSGERRVPWALPAGTSRGTVVRTEYFISDYFSVIAETDREANVGGDVKLRLRF